MSRGGHPQSRPGTTTAPGGGGPFNGTSALSTTRGNGVRAGSGAGTDARDVTVADAAAAAAGAASVAGAATAAVAVVLAAAVAVAVAGPVPDACKRATTRLRRNGLYPYCRVEETNFISPAAAMAAALPPSRHTAYWASRNTGSSAGAMVAIK